MRRTIALAAALASPTAAVDIDGSSLAAQPVAIGAGARAMGMGGAFAAVADDATASTWNPAGLTQCERPEASLSASLTRFRSESVDGTADQDTRAEIDHAAAMLPFFAFGCMQTVGVSWMRQYDMGRAVAWETITTGDLAVDERQTRSREGSLATLGVTWAVEPAPGLSFGATLNRWDDRLTGASAYEEHATLAGTSVFSDAGLELFRTVDTVDVNSELEVQSGTSLVLGAMWQAVPWLTVAAVVRPSSTLDVRRSLTSVNTVDVALFGIPEPTITTVRSTTSDLEVRLPPMATLALAWRPDDERTVAFDATWTRWSLFRVRDGDGQRSPLHPTVDPDDFSDLWTLRLGYEQAVVLDRAVLVPRAGVLVEWTPAITRAPDIARTDEVEADDDLWLGASAGLGVFTRSILWDLAVQVRHAHNAGSGQFTSPDESADVTLVTLRGGVSVQF
jgi:long-subunit fatty acid transport protein